MHRILSFLLIFLNQTYTLLYDVTHADLQLLAYMYVHTQMHMHSQEDWNPFGSLNTNYQENYVFIFAYSNNISIWRMYARPARAELPPPFSWRACIYYQYTGRSPFVCVPPNTVFNLWAYGTRRTKICLLCSGRELQPTIINAAAR